MPEIDILLKASNQASGPIQQVNKDLGALENTAKSAKSGGFGSLLGTLGTTVAAGAAVAATALGALGVAVGVAGTNFNNMKQQAQIAFTTMLGSGGQAKEFLDDLQGFAASTPFEFPELLAASQRMLAMGFAAEDVKPTLTAVGDAVAGLGGSGEMVGRVTTALGQMQAKGKASAEEMMQLTEAGIPGWQFLADAIGTDVAGAMEAVSKGTVSADTAISALVDGMNSKFGGLMEQQSKTFGGLLSTIKDTFTQVSGTVMQPLFELMTEGLAAIVAWTSSPAFTGGIEAITRAMELAAQAATALFGDIAAGETVLDALTHAFAILLPPDLYQTWQGFKAILDSIFAAAQLLVTGDFSGGIFGLAENHPAILALGLIHDLVAGLFAVITGNMGVMDFFVTTWQGAWELIQQTIDFTVDYVQTHLATWIATLQGWALAAWEWIVAAAPLVLTALATWLGGIIQWLGDRLPDFIATIYTWATALVNWITDTIPAAIDALAEFVSGVRKGGDQAGGQFGGMVGKWATTLWRWIVDDLIPKVGPAFWDFIEALMGYGASMLTSLGGLVAEVGKLLWHWIVVITPIAVDKLRDWGQKLWGWINSNLPEWMRQLYEWAQATWQWIADATTPALIKLSEWGAALWGWITEQAPTWYDKLKKWATAAWEWITKIAIPEALKKLGEWGAALWGWVTDNAPAWWEALKAWGAAAWEWITKIAIPMAIEKMNEWDAQLRAWVTTNAPIWAEKMQQAGSDLIQGLWDGVKKKWDEFTNWFFQETVLGRFLKDFEDFFWMGSPSRLMWGYGQDIMAGLQEGIAAGVPGLQSEMQYVAEQIKASMDQINADMLASTEYFTKQAETIAQASHYKIAHMEYSPKEIQDLLDKLMPKATTPAAAQAAAAKAALTKAGAWAERPDGTRTFLPEVLEAGQWIKKILEDGSAVLENTYTKQWLPAAKYIETATELYAGESNNVWARLGTALADLGAAPTSGLFAVSDPANVIGTPEWAAEQAKRYGLTPVVESVAGVVGGMGDKLKEFSKGVERLYERATKSDEMIGNMAGLTSLRNMRDMITTRLTEIGARAGVNNTFNLTLESSGDAVEDLVSTFDLLKSLYGTAGA